MSYRSLPTIGYESQAEAVIALYEARCEPRAIATRTGIPLNSVHRVLSKYRKRTGRRVEPMRRAPAAEPTGAYDRLWDMDEPDRRVEIAKRAAAGAKQAREAAGL